jgi:hypothetical protein
VKPRIIVYVCPSCGTDRVTYLRDHGTTPNHLPCASCDGLAESHGTQSDQTRIPQWEWFRVRQGNMGRLEPNVREWAMNGGLLLRRIRKQSSEPPPPNRRQRRAKAAQERTA